MIVVDCSTSLGREVSCCRLFGKWWFYSWVGSGYKWGSEVSFSNFRARSRSRSCESSGFEWQDK